MKIRQYLINEKSIEQQKAERKAETDKEFTKIPISIRRAMDKRISDNKTKQSGGYVEGGYAGNKQQEKDSKALWEFERKASKKELMLLKKYEQYKRIGY